MMTLNCFYGDLMLKPYYTANLKFVFRKEHVSNKSNDLHKEERVITSLELRKEALMTELQFLDKIGSQARK